MARNPLYRGRSGRFTGRPTRRRLRRKRRGGWHNNPLIKINGRKRRRGGRRRHSRRRGRRKGNPLIRLNPFKIGGVFGRVKSGLARVTSVSSWKQAAGIAAGVLISGYVAQRYAGQYMTSPLWAAGVTAAAGAVASAIVALALPWAAPLVLTGGLVTGAVTLLQSYVVPALPGMGDFLTIGPRGLPARQVAGMGDFLETRQGLLGGGLRGPVGNMLS